MAENEKNTKEFQPPAVFDERIVNEQNTRIKNCLFVISEYNILCITDLVAYLPFCRATFYNYQLDKVDSIKEAIENQRIKTKQLLKARWMQPSASATCQIALYKLLGTKEERAALSNNFVISNEISTTDTKQAYIETLKNMNNAD